MPQVAPNATGVRAHFLLRDSTTGQAAMSVAHTAVKMYIHETYKAPRLETPTNLVTSNLDPHSGLAWKEVDPTNMPGLYTYDTTDATWATTSGKEIILQPSAVASPAPFFTAPIRYDVVNPNLTTANYDNIRDAVWEAVLSGYGANTAGEKVFNLPSAVDAAIQVWSRQRSLSAGVGTFGEGVNVLEIDGNGISASHLSLAMLGGTILTVDTGTFPSTTTQFETSTAGLSSVNNFYKDKLAYGITGNLAEQVQQITAYDGTNQRFTVAGFTAAPSHGSIIFLS